MVLYKWYYNTRMDLSYKYGSVGYIKNPLDQFFCPVLGMEEHDGVS